MTVDITNVISYSLTFCFILFSAFMLCAIFIYSFIVLNNGKWEKAHKNYVNYVYIAFLLCIAVSYIRSNGGEQYDIFASAGFALASIFASAIMIKLLKVKEDACFIWYFISIIGSLVILAIVCAIPPSNMAYPLIMLLRVCSGLLFGIPMIYANCKFLLLIYKRVKQ